MPKTLRVFIFLLLALCSICVSGVVFYRAFIYPKEQIRDAEAMLGASIPDNAEEIRVDIATYPAGASLIMRLNLPAEATDNFVMEVCKENVNLLPNYEYGEFIDQGIDWWDPPTTSYIGTTCCPDDSRLITILVVEGERNDTIFISVSVG